MRVRKMCFTRNFGILRSVATQARQRPKPEGAGLGARQVALWGQERVYALQQTSAGTLLLGANVTVGNVCVA